jgi:hypothetical protein
MKASQFLIFALILLTFILVTSKNSEAQEAGIAEVETEGGENTSFSESTESSKFPISINYFGIFYGGAVSDPGSGFQPNYAGDQNENAPVHLRNFLALNYGVTQEIGVSAVGYWAWQPAMDQAFQLRDPFLRMSHNSIVSIGNLNLYGDLRLHMPVSTVSREYDMLFGAQTVQALTYGFENSDLSLGLYASQRMNWFGSQGYGNDTEFYLAPCVSYQLASNVALNVLYEMQASHPYGNSFGTLNNDGTDLEPGVIWDITPNLMLNPYLHFLTGGKVNMDTTSFGMMMSWNML